MNENKLPPCKYSNFMMWFILNKPNEYGSDTARALGCTRQCISNWSLGITKPRIEMLYDICNYFATEENSAKDLMMSAVRAIVIDIRVNNGDYDDILKGSKNESN